MDDGKALNPLEKEEVDTTRSVEEKPIGGLGIHFARKLLDGLEYKRKANKNLLTMRKKLLK